MRLINALNYRWLPMPNTIETIVQLHSCQVVPLHLLYSISNGQMSTSSLIQGRGRRLINVGEPTIGEGTMSTFKLTSGGKGGGGGRKKEYDVGCCDKPR